MRVLHIIPSIDLSQGGPSRTAVNLANSLASIDDCILCFYTYSSHSSNCLQLSDKILAFFQYRRFRLPYFIFSDFFRVRKIIKEHKIDIVHIHGVWHWMGHCSAKAAFFENVPYVVQPRGMLEPWALQYRRLKKIIALTLYQKLDLRRAAGFIATSAQEFNSIRAVCTSSDVSVIPNGVESIVNDVLIDKNDTIKTALFMARIHPKKGVYELVRVWGKLRPNGWCLRIVGPDDGGHLDKIRSLVVDLNLEDNIAVVGPLYGENRENEYLNAHLFVLPTYSENFGVAVAEALAYGVPVLTTKGAPWSSLIDNNCGWWIEPGEDSLADALPKALSLTHFERLEMGRRAQSLAASFDWNKVGLQTFEFYSTIISKFNKR